MGPLRSDATSMIAYACATLALCLAPFTVAQSSMPIDTGITPGHFATYGTTGCSAQQLFLGSDITLYVVDKVERNDNFTVGNPVHPAWASEMNLLDRTIRPFDIVTNSFCAGGGVTANGTWCNVGGNQAVTTAGDTLGDGSGVGIANPYGDLAGGSILRTINTCTDKSCQWVEWPDLTQNRWYPTVETLANGTILIIGGELHGGYVNAANQNQNNPTTVLWPDVNNQGDVPSNFLATTQPLNLYPITFLMPNGYLFMNAGYNCILFNPNTSIETPIANLPNAVRVYPASGASVMLPLTPENGYTPTLLFCGGNEEANSDTVYNPNAVDITQFKGSQHCDSITLSNDPVAAVNAQWIADDDLLEGRVLTQFILLPDGTAVVLNGCAQGTAGYGWQNFGNNGQGYGKVPLFTPAIYDPTKPAGSRWSRDGLGNATYPRMYHSTAILLPDGAVMTAGSNPNADFIGPGVNETDPYWTTYTAEKWYPPYYNKPRPQPTGLPTSVGYGGPYFNISLPAGSIASNDMLNSTHVVLCRTGFSTHSMNMGMRNVKLQTTVTANSDGSATLHVAPLPPNPNIIAPGPSLLFVMVNGVPSMGKMIMIGSGQIQDQPVLAPVALPSTTGVIGDPIASSSSASSRTSTGTSSSSSTGSPSASGGNAATAVAIPTLTSLLVMVAAVAFGVLGGGWTVT